MQEPITLPSLLKLTPPTETNFKRWADKPNETGKRVKTLSIKRNQQDTTVDEKVRRTPPVTTNRYSSKSVVKEAHFPVSPLSGPPYTRSHQSSSGKLLKLYNPQLYRKFTQKINDVREKYMNLYQQLCGPDIETKTLHDLVTTTEGALTNTYSIKYFGVNNNQIGILSKRVPLKPAPKESSPKKSPRANTQELEPLQYSIAGERITYEELIRRRSYVGSAYGSDYGMASVQSHPTQGYFSQKTSQRPTPLPSAQGYDKNRHIMAFNSTTSTGPMMPAMDNGARTHTHMSNSKPTEPKMNTESKLIRTEDNFPTQGSDVNPPPLSSPVFVPNELRLFGTRESDEINQGLQGLTIGDRRGVSESAKGGVASDALNIYSGYIVNKYLLPKHLKAVKKQGELTPKSRAELVFKRNGQDLVEKNKKNHNRKLNEIKKIRRQMLRNINLKELEVEDRPFIVDKFKPFEMKNVFTEQEKFSYAKLLNTMFSKDDPENVLIEKDDQIFQMLMKRVSPLEAGRKEDPTKVAEIKTKWAEKRGDVKVKITHPENNEMYACYQRVKEKAKDALVTTPSHRDKVDKQC